MWSLDLRTKNKCVSFAGLNSQVRLDFSKIEHNWCECHHPRVSLAERRRILMFGLGKEIGKSSMSPTGGGASVSSLLVLTIRCPLCVSWEVANLGDCLTRDVVPTLTVFVTLPTSSEDWLSHCGVIVSGASVGSSRLDLASM